jgi:hypothetical protein
MIVGDHDNAGDKGGANGTFPGQIHALIFLHPRAGFTSTTPDEMT